MSSKNEYTDSGGDVKHVEYLPQARRGIKAAQNNCCCRQGSEKGNFIFFISGGIILLIQCLSELFVIQIIAAAIRAVAAHAEASELRRVTATRCTFFLHAQKTTARAFLLSTPLFTHRVPSAGFSVTFVWRFHRARTSVDLIISHFEAVTHFASHLLISERRRHFRVEVRSV